MIYSPGLDGKDCWSRQWGSGSADLCSCGFVGENRQHRFFDEHGLDDGLVRPGKKIHQGDTLMKTGAAADNGSLHGDANSAALDGLCKSRVRLGAI